MRRIGITQRVVMASSYYERRDALDQKWFEFLSLCEFQVVIIPNLLVDVRQYIEEFKLDGIILTGGNDLQEYGGDAQERDLLEKRLIECCIEKKIPLLGVCRGMQLLNVYAGGSLVSVKNQVTKSMKILFKGEERIVNSYHNYGVAEVSENYSITGISKEGGVIKSIEHKEFPLMGIMWHPERNIPFDQNDVKLLKEIFENK